MTKERNYPDADPLPEPLPNAAASARSREDINGNLAADDAIGSSKTQKLFASALLAKAERDELLVEIFTYFRWLERGLTASRGGARRAAEAGFTVAAVSHVVGLLESSFGVVRDNATVLRGVVDGLLEGGRVPFLETCSAASLGKRYTGVRLSALEQTTWDVRYGELTRCKSMISDCSHAELNRRSRGLGDWLQEQQNLYAKQDPEFMKHRARKLDAAGFVWWRPPPKRQKTTPAARQLPLAASRIPPATAAAGKPAAGALPYEFETMFQELAEYKAEHGDCIVPFATPRLGRWVNAVRSTVRDMGRDAGIGDSSGDGGGIAAAATATGGFAKVWAKAPPGRLGLAVRFPKDKEGAEVTNVYESCPFAKKVREGDCIVSIDGNSIVKPEDLAIAMEKHRTICLMRKKTYTRTCIPLTQEQIERLNAIGFHWKPGGRTRSWEDSYQNLLAYVQTHGDTRVPMKYVAENGHKLGEWVHRQRHRYRIKDPAFMADYAPKLETIGFEWKPANAYFQSKFKDLVEYKRVHGHVNVPWNYKKDNEYKVLGRWCASLRYSRHREEERRGKDTVEEEKKNRGGQTHDILTKERIELLDSLGFDWTWTGTKRP